MKKLKSKKLTKSYLQVPVWYSIKSGKLSFRLNKILKDVSRAFKNCDHRYELQVKNEQYSDNSGD